MGFGFGETKQVGHELVAVGALVCIIPVFGIIGLIALAIAASCESVSQCALICMGILLVAAGVFDVVGGIFLIAGGAQAGNNVALAYGVTAGVFGILAGLSCCFSVPDFVIACNGKSDSTKSNSGGDGL